METKKALQPTSQELASEIDRLAAKGLLHLGYTENELERLAQLTWRVQALKKERRAVIPAHVYQRAEILAGVADFIGDSYKLAKLCAGTDAERIVFCGVRFMAETAKILNPDKDVLLPAQEAGCSLAESITGEDVRKLKSSYSGVPVVSYINTSAEVKAESDVIVTSANASKILRWMFERHARLIFLPDEWMGRNLARELKRELGSELIIWTGKCVVHENFEPSSVPMYRRMYPGIKILAHAECSPALVQAVDFVGGTGDMMRYVRGIEAPYYMLVTECGLGDLARREMPEKRFIPMCRLCPYMKAIDLEHVLEALQNPKPHHTIQVPPAIQERAKKALERMFQIAEDDSPR